MRLRELEKKDAVYMIEWMHDTSITKDLFSDFSSKTIEDAESFIQASKVDHESIHLAIASDQDEYMGTVSLKHVNNNTAEFAITVRSCALGKGYSWFGMEEILKIAFTEMHLDCVYWCVSINNLRARRFYDKHHFNQILDVPEEIKSRYSGRDDLLWYSVLLGDTLAKADAVAGCKVVHIKTVPTVNAGELSFFEADRDIPFDIKRVYYISKVPEGMRRGFHAHKNLKQLLFCPYGRIQLVLENKNGREEIELSDPSVGVIIDQVTWREMLWIQKDSVLCVAASDYYDSDDYIRDYSQFKQMINE